MTSARLALTREQILAFRRRAGALDQRLPAGPASVRRAAWAGLQDSMPRAALLSLHARMAGVGPDALEDPQLVQVWGPRFSAYAVAAPDRAVFTLGRLPDPGDRLRYAEELADALDAFLGGRRLDARDAARGLGVHPNQLRYAAPTGRVLIRWDGAHQPFVWTVPAPDVDPFAARLDLARRHVHVFGPTTAASFGEWAGIKPPRASAAFEALATELTPVRTPLGEAWVLAADEEAFRAPAGRSAGARLLPSGDTYFLLQGADRALLVPDPARRARLWTTRVWPGAVLVDGELAGTWRRAGAELTIEPWRSLDAAARQAVEGEAATLPLPGVRGPVRVRWAESRRGSCFRIDLYNARLL